MSEHEDEQQDQGAERRPLHSDELRYRHVRREVADSLWAIRPVTLAVIRDLLDYRSQGYRLSAEEVQERIGVVEARSSAAKTAGGGAVAVLPLYGIIAKRASSFQSVSSPSGTGVDAFTQMFRKALADPEVASILIEVDSPGGTADMVQELADEIRGARGRKPIVAIANTMAASAAYWIASQADEIVVTPSGRVGSIGVYAAHEDLSGALEQEGVKVTLISAGKFKTEGNPFEPLSEEARVHFQEMVDECYASFLSSVAKGRGVTADDVKANFGEGRMVSAKAAVTAGMADKVDTFDATVSRMLRGNFASRGSKAETERTIEASGDIQRLALKPGDKLLYRSEDISPDQAAEIKAQLMARFPGHEIVVMGGNASLAVIEGSAPTEEQEDREAASVADLALVEGADASTPWVRDAVREQFAPAT